MTSNTRALGTEKSPPRERSMGLALGGGGARGLAHIVMLEAFDELGLKPAVISGTSIGAIFGAAYASGIPAKEIREHAQVAVQILLGCAPFMVAIGIVEGFVSPGAFFPWPLKVLSGALSGFGLWRWLLRSGR